MIPFSLDQKRFLEAPLVRQADSELKKASLFLFSIEFELGKFFGNATYRYVINVLVSHIKAHLISFISFCWQKCSFGANSVQSK